MSEYGQRLQTISGFLKMAPRVVFGRIGRIVVVGRRKKSQMLSGRTRV